MPGTTLSSLPECACAYSSGSPHDHAETAFCRMHSIWPVHQENGSMDIDGLKTFVAIAELGGPLFDRLRGRARLTEAGRAFRPYAEAALAALKDGQEAVRDLQSGLSGSLSLALVGTLADTHIVDTLRRFRNRARGVRLEL